MSLLDNAALNLAARAKDKANTEYHETWLQATANVERLDVNRFWAILELWKSSILNLDRHDVSKYACDELFRQCICDDLIVRGKSLAQGGGKVTFDELVRFIENYEAITAALHDYLFDVVEGKGDDSYGDLCDGLPLIGREGVKLLLSMDNNHENNPAVEGIIRDNCGKHDADKWTDMIWNGENYWRMFLGDEAERRYVREACDHDPKPEILDLV